ncbi:MAG: dolichyl-phosphate beta-glucosyltransferase [Patescibacteria group bacterium]
MQLSVIIPAYNEESTIQSTVIAVADYLRAFVPDSEIIVVDDGSTDETKSIIRSLSLEIPLGSIVHITNKGKGAAVHTGMKAAKGERILFVDADMSTDIKQYDALARALDDDADIAIGSRYLRESHIAVQQPWFRVMIGRIANSIIRLVFLPGIYDTQCGFKAFKREAALALADLQTMDGWSFDMELLVLARRLGYRIIEIPIVWQNSNRVSRFRSIHDAGKTLGDMVRIWYRLATHSYQGLDSRKKIR